MILPFLRRNFADLRRNFADERILLMQDVIQFFIALTLVALICIFIIKLGRKIPTRFFSTRYEDPIQVRRRLLSGRAVFDDDAPPPRREDGPDLPPLVAQKGDFGCFFVVLGFAMSIAAVFFAYDSGSFVGRAALVRGEVVSIESMGKMHLPVIRYAGDQGEQRTFRPRVITSILIPSVGDPVDLLYDKANPADVRIASFWDLYLLSIAFGGIGALLLCLAARALMRAPPD
jgi:hypothetical protein